ncbi:hypothetical protein [Tsukamurella spumae]|uniref:Uncharacterized protein n=1 Tax=Tsukamurella spumae TaxID=44753 RepID=A0A846WWR2_9ACTN|nr:hypothetical protein [Tsukamurella spumae]NKY17598.1 hypothetical protein [Tsukamurella spumae]
MGFDFVWTNHRDEWRAAAGPVIGVLLFGTLGVLALVATPLLDVGLAFLGIAVLTTGLIVPQLGGRQGETVRLSPDGVRIEQAAWWKNGATYLLSGLCLLLAGMAATVVTDPEGGLLMLVLGSVLGVCLAVMVFVLWRGRRAFVFGQGNVVTPRGRVIGYDRLLYRLYEPPRGAPSVEIGLVDGPKPENMTAFGYMISPSTVLSTLDALTAGDRVYTGDEIRAMLAVPPQQGVAEGESVVLRLSAALPGGEG